MTVLGFQSLEEGLDLCVVYVIAATLPAKEGIVFIPHQFQVR